MAIALPVVTTILVVVTVGALVIVEQQRQAQATESADTVAQEFMDSVHAFRTDLTSVIEQGRDGSPAELAVAVQQRLDAPPELPVLEGEAVELSAAYRDAQYLEATMLTPYVDLVDALGRIAVARDFIAAAEVALSLRIEDITGTTTIRETSIVTDRVIPAFEDALGTFEAVAVPGGQEDLAAAVSAAVQNVIDQSRLLVSFAALGQNYSFTYGSQIAAAAEAVRLYGLTVDADLSTAIDAALPG